VNHRTLVDVFHGGHDAILEFLFGCDTNAAQGRPTQLGKEALDNVQPRTVLGCLAIAAIVYWNSAYIADAVAHLQGKEDPDDALLAHTTPLTWEHIGFSGDFLWERACARPPKDHCSRKVPPWRCLSNNRRYDLDTAGNDSLYGRGFCAIAYFQPKSKVGGSLVTGRREFPPAERLRPLFDCR
jgi:Tn3 transposase DDE domain